MSDEVIVPTDIVVDNTINITFKNDDISVELINSDTTSDIYITTELIADSAISTELKTDNINIDFTEAPVIISPLEDVRYKGISVVQDNVADIPIQSPTDILSTDQLSAVNSGITSDKIATYNGYLTLISANTTAISNETARASVAEALLDNNITDEATARSGADTLLQDNINNEETARINADTGLQNNIDAEQTAREDADETLQSNISSEALTRANADSLLQSNISSEASTRASADLALQSQISDEATARATAVSSEATLRANADTAEATARANADTTLQQNITDEASARETAISDEVINRNNAIASEATLRQNADTQLQTNITNEATARANADATKVDKVEGYSLTKNDLTDALKATYDGYQAQINTKQRTLVAGVGITISDASVISADTAFHAQVFTTLPTPSADYKNTIALVLKPGTSQYYQYMCTTEDNGTTWSWKQVGTTDIDLSAYKVWTDTKTYIDNADDLKVDKVTGKGLSTNDYTTAEKDKLDSIEANADVNIIEIVKVNGNALSVTDKAVDVVFPKYNSTTMTSATNIPEVKTATWDGKSVVSGTNDGINWTSITINGTTYYIPSQTTEFKSVWIQDVAPDAGSVGIAGDIILCRNDGKIYECGGGTVGAYIWTAMQIPDTSPINYYYFLTGTEKSNIASNTSARHTHSNKSTLDNITGIDTTVTSGSGNLITSGAVYTVVGDIESLLEALR